MSSSPPATEPPRIGAVAPARPRRDLARFGWLAFFAALGLLFAWYTVSQFADHMALSSRGQRAEAVVVGWEEVRGRRSTSHYPVFRFNGADGKPVQATSSVSATPSDMPRGRRVAVIYDPSNPSHVRAADAVAAGPGIGPWITGVLALLMFGLGALFLLPKRATPPG